MARDTERRRADVLYAIVKDFISSHEPVGSKILVDRHGLGVSSATIRNDMAVLEGEGYITQQHSSSGRIPTAKGYRRFVDGISDIKPLSAPERRAILEFLENGVDLEDVLRRSVQLLSQLTSQVAIVQLPNPNVGRVKHCEVVSLTPRRLLLVLILDTGRVDQRNVECRENLHEEGAALLKESLNKAMVGKTLAEARQALSELDVPMPLQNIARDCVTVLSDTLLENHHDRLILSGANHLMRAEDQSLDPVIDALEQQVVVLKLLSAVRDMRVQVSIGEENESEELHGASVISTGYGIYDNDDYGTREVLGGLGVVGPTYLDYHLAMSKVTAVAHYVSRIISGT